MKAAEFKKLGDYVKIKTGKLDANASSDDGEYPFFTCSIEPLKISSFSYDCECCLVAGNGDLNVKYYNGKFDAYQRTYIIESLDKEKLDVMYLYFFLCSYIEVLRKQSIGGVIKYIKLGNLTDALIPIPSLEKQKKICRNLIKAQKVLNENQALFSKYDSLIKSRFIEMIGDPVLNEKKWKIKKLGDIIRVLGGYAFSSKAFKDFGIPVLRIGNINSGVFRPTNMVFWDDDEKIERYAIYPGDLVMSLTGTVGKDDYGNVCILGNDYPKYYLNQRNAKLEIISDLERFYLSYLLKFPEIKSRLTNISRGIRQANIANKDIENLQIPVPPLSLQNDFASFVQQIDKSKFEIANSLKRLYNKGMLS